MVDKNDAILYFFILEPIRKFIISVLINTFNILDDLSSIRSPFSREKFRQRQNFCKIRKISNGIIKTAPTRRDRC